MARKRTRKDDDKFDTIVSINEPSSSATLQGKLTSLSPMKKSKTCDYFDGQLTDETANFRFVGYNSAIQKKLLTFQEQDHPVALSRCQIQPSRKTQVLELKLSPATQFQKGSKQFDIPEHS